MKRLFGLIYGALESNHTRDHLEALQDHGLREKSLQINVNKGAFKDSRYSTLQTNVLT